MARSVVAKTMAGKPVDLSEAELVEFQIEGKEGMTRIRVNEGATLELRLIINNVYRLGNDPVTGAPNYVIQSQTVSRLVNFDKSLRKPALRQPRPGEGSPSTGVG